MTTTKSAASVRESGIFPTIQVREVDLDLLLVDALDAATPTTCVEIERAGLYEDDSVVLGDRDRLARAFATLVSTCFACMERRAVLRISLQRDIREWVMRMEHRIRPDVPLDDGAVDLAFTRSVLVGHDGAFIVRTDPVRRMRAIVASLPSVGR
jgi:hypothetical protein